MGHATLVHTDPSTSYPDFLLAASSRKNASDQIDAAPILVRMDKKDAVDQLQQLLAGKNGAVEVIDNYAEQYAELLLSKNAHLYRANHEVQVASLKELLDEHFGSKEPWKLGTWVYFPWKSQLVHILAQTDFEVLRTIRNRDLITAEEQKRLFNYRVAAFGMSVGSAGALAMGISGISRKIKLIDGAVISGSNLNRVLTGVSSVGINKAVVIGRQIYEMNPYSTVAYFPKATKEELGKIIDEPWGVDLVIDEIDDIEMKVRIRNEARRRRIPVVMATELGDTVVLDVERFDTEPDRPLLHDMVPGLEDLLIRPVENYREWTRHAVNIINPENMTIKMQKSLMKIGTTIVTHPQLGSTVMMTGGVLAFAVKTIALGGALQSGRYVVSLEREFLADHQTRRYRREHKKHTKLLRDSVNAM